MFELQGQRLPHRVVGDEPRLDQHLAEGTFLLGLALQGDCQLFFSDRPVAQEHFAEAWPLVVLLQQHRQSVSA